MRNRRIVRSRCTAGVVMVAVAAVPLTGGAGCANGQNARSGRSAPTPAAQNRQNADELLREAEQAENRGDYSRAAEVYNQLRSFPESSRPRDLEQRIRRLEAKTNTNTSGQR